MKVTCERCGAVVDVFIDADAYNEAGGSRFRIQMAGQAPEKCQSPPAAPVPIDDFLSWGCPDLEAAVIAELDRRRKESGRTA